jgi:biuret amidohydrolase
MTNVDGMLVPTRLADICNQSHTALLVYDMQVGIRAQVKGADAIVAKCAEAIAAARSVGMRIAYTRHLSCSTAWMGATQYRTAMAWQRTDDPNAIKPWFQRGAPGVEIVPELAPASDDMVFEKLSMSAFEGTPLAFALRDCGILGIAICGIALEIGIAPTILHATDLGFVPILIEDACGPGNAEAGARALESIRFVGEAILTDVTNFADLVRTTHPSVPHQNGAGR